MKILVMTNLDVGLYQFRRELIAKLQKKHEVLLSLPDGELVRPFEEMGCRFLSTPVDRRGLHAGKDLSLFCRYRRMLKKEKPDLVITYTIKPNIYGGLACRLAGIPYAANITGLGTAFQKRGALRALVTRMYRAALKHAHTVFFENSGNMETLLTEQIVRREQCCLLPGAGVNLERYAPAPYPSGEAPVRFLFIGRVMAEKGIGELFSAMERLHREAVPCSLDVVGGYEENYADRIQEYTAQGWLVYHGYQKDVRPFIERAHCFVLPSWHEGMANTNLECAAMGRPLITSRIHGCMEAVVEGESGLLCEPQDADSLYDCMLRFCRMPSGSRRAMGEAGRHHMEAVFDRRNVVSATLERIM
ncbi:MAG: glycosyltransferase family 4 protein [Eubacteriales bacterium]